jgi:hypothetical protein
MRTILLALMVLFGAHCEPAQPAQPKTVLTWAFCGVHPDDPYAAQKVLSLSRDSGFAATFGPCLRPDMTTYTTAEPGRRYGTPELYKRLVQLNASVGMKTVVYDARLWSLDPSVVQEAYDQWWPYLPNIAAWDMGDEFDPNWPEQWNELVSRWDRMQFVEDRTGIAPFTNHLGWESALDKALTDLPGKILSFDIYDVPTSLAMAREYDGLTPTLMCAVNALKHGPYSPTAVSLKKQMKEHRAAGCDMLLVFGGEMPIDTDGFVTPSAVTWNGKPTKLASAIYWGSR